MGWEATLEDGQKQAAMKLGGKVEPKKIHITVGHDPRGREIRATAVGLPPITFSPTS